MTFAAADETQIAFVEESTWGTTPASPSWQKMRVTGESLNLSKENIVSNELRADASVADLIQVAERATGDLNFEMSFGADFNTLLEHALRGSYSTNTLKAGTEKKSVSIEKLFETGATDHYLRFTGCRVGSFNLNQQARQIVTGSLSLLGQGGSVATAALSGATYDDANSNDVMAAQDTASITVGGVSSTIYYTEMSLALNNNLREQPAIGNSNMVGIAYGRREITGRLVAYFEDDDLYEEFIAGNASSLTYQITDGTNSYTVTVPNLKYSTGRVVAGGNNQDVLQEFDFQALYDVSEATDLKIVKSS